MKQLLFGKAAAIPGISFQLLFAYILSLLVIGAICVSFLLPERL